MQEGELLALLWDEQAEKDRMFLTDISGDLLKLMDLLEDPHEILL